MPRPKFNLATLDAAYQYTNSDFSTDISEVPRSWLEPNAYYIRDNMDAWRQLYQDARNPDNSVTNPGFMTTGQLQLQMTFDVDEKTSEIYLRADSDNQVFGRRLRGNFGLRYINVQTDMNFYSVDATTPVVTPSSASKTASKVLPGLTLRYDVNDDVLVRFNYGETLRRPNFGDLNPVLKLGDDVSHVGYGSGSGGNPDLEPTESKNLNLTAEWYFQ